jgi:putative MFS transporter
VGAVVAYLVEFAFTRAFGADSWRWKLASGPVFGVIVMVLRMGAHESPRWLITKGRIEEARKDISSVLGREVTTEEIADIVAQEEPQRRA